MKITEIDDFDATITPAEEVDLRDLGDFMVRYRKRSGCSACLAGSCGRNSTRSLIMCSPMSSRPSKACASNSGG